MKLGAPGRCTCGARGVQIVIEDGKLSTPGHVCPRSVSPSGTSNEAKKGEKPSPHAPAAVANRGAEVSGIRSARSFRAAAAPPFAPLATLTGRTLRLWLPRAVRSDEGPNGRVWRRRAHAAAEWRQLVALALEGLGDRRPRWDRARIHYELFTRGAAIDPDNRVALGKPILDGLVAAGVLPDDRDGQVESVTAAWARSPLPWGFVVVSATLVRS